MTTIDGLLGWAGRRMVSKAETNARMRARRARMGATAGSVLLAIWHLLLVVGGLGAVTFGVYQINESVGWIVGGLCVFVLRALVTWDGGGQSAPRT